MSSLSVTHAEKWWVMKMLMSHYFHFCLDLNELLKTMFPDSQIAKSFRLSKTKCYYNLVFRLAPLNSDSHLPKRFVFFESPLKMMKNAFYFKLKALFVLKIFKFLSQLFAHLGKAAGLERQS